MNDSFADGLVGVVLDGRYRLDAVLGEGGMGAVFRATQLAVDRKVAVKLLKPHLSSDATALKRFAREARATFKIDSPHAVKVLDYGITPERDYYLVLEYLDGRTVQRELEVDGPFSPARVAHVAAQVLGALAAAHRVGLVHRDLKPENILLLRDGADPDHAKVLDFGVAKLMDGTASPALSALVLTQQGMVFGTPEFMSPEQACGLPLDGRSDLYSLAATMFAMLTGRGLFDADRPIAWLTAHATEPPPHLGDVAPQLAKHRALDALLQRCLAKRKEQRPASADTMADELRAIAAAEAGGGAAARTAPASTAKTLFATSSQFVAALATAQTGAQAAAADAIRETTTTSGEVRALRGGRSRGVWFAIGAAMAVGVVATAIGLAVRRTAPADGARASAATPNPTPNPMPNPTPNPTPTPNPNPMPNPTPNPNPNPNPTPTPTPIAKPSAKPDPHAAAAAAHLQAAQAARASGNHLRQLAEADLALRADPSSAAARFLLGDALVATGDLEHGCKYLRALAKLPAAIARARTAGCP